MQLDKNKKGQFVEGAGLIDLTGQKYGRLEILVKSEKRVGRKTYWVCQCECGTIKEIRSDTLRSKTKPIRSCGCLKAEQDLINFGVSDYHGQTKHPLFGRWNAMIHRCENPKSHAYKNYGGRGIQVCEEWHDVRNFIDWAERNGFEEGLTLERKDVNGHYEPNNCTFIPMEEQHYNKTTSVFVEYNGEKLTVMQWAHKLSIPHAEVWGYKSKGIDFKDLIRKYQDNTEVT
ncbi:hypothetical protein MKX57_17415 [Lysinibacillus sp. FSL M8-0216]|uniref:hypothetical protein n=1 Tax=Lysinibacillus TaxID=400634 RepID=UPI00315AD14E